MENHQVNWVNTFLAPFEILMVKLIQADHHQFTLPLKLAKGHSIRLYLTRAFHNFRTIGKSMAPLIQKFASQSSIWLFIEHLQEVKGPTSQVVYFEVIHVQYLPN